MGGNMGVIKSIFKPRDKPKIIRVTVSEEDVHFLLGERGRENL